jgi:hypothetical protein
LYGRKQTPRDQFQHFAAVVTKLRFVASRSDASLFIYNTGDDVALILLYVDDILLTSGGGRDEIKVLLTRRGQNLQHNLDQLISEKCTMKAENTLQRGHRDHYPFTLGCIALKSEKNKYELGNCICLVKSIKKC